MSFIERHESLATADAVLAYLEYLISARTVILSKGTAVVLAAYQNGREQGYTIRVWPSDPPGMTIVFSQHRSSDQIVVYETANVLFNTLDDEAYNNRLEFGNVESAAHHILRRIVEGSKS